MYRILLLVKTPPPITGATLMNKRVVNSKLINSSFKVRSINISYVKKVSELGSYNFKKIIKILIIGFQLFIELLFYRPKLVYFQISPLRVAFFRDLIFVFLIKLFRIRIIYHLRGKGISKEIHSKWKKRLYKFAFCNEEVICLSDLLVFDVGEVHSGRIHIVNNGIPDVDKSLISKVITNEGTSIKILFLSNLIASKGVYDFINSFEYLKQLKFTVKGLIVGAESDITMQELNQTLISKDLANYLEYLGPKYDLEKFAIISESDIVVFPTKNDIWGNIILEAMQFCKPVIATREGAIPEIIDDGITGFLVEKASPDQIAEKIEILISNPDQRRTMGEAARKKYEKKYTLQHFEENMKRVFEIVLDDINKKTKK